MSPHNDIVNEGPFVRNAFTRRVSPPHCRQISMRLMLAHCTRVARCSFSICVVRSSLPAKSAFSEFRVPRHPLVRIRVAFNANIIRCLGRSGFSALFTCRRACAGFIAASRAARSLSERNYDCGHFHLPKRPSRAHTNTSIIIVNNGVLWLT